MIFDVNLELAGVDEDFLEELEELIEDYMVNFFLLNPKDEAALNKAAELAAKMAPFYYTAPYGMVAADDAKCVGIYLNQPVSSETLEHINSPLIIDGSILDSAMLKSLEKTGKKGIVLDAKLDMKMPEGFYAGISPRTISQARPEWLETVQMERIVWQSNFPKNDYDDLYAAVKTLSDALFRPEESIIAHATNNTLSCLGLR